MTQNVEPAPECDRCGGDLMWTGEAWRCVVCNPWVPVHQITEGVVRVAEAQTERMTAMAPTRRFDLPVIARNLDGSGLWHVMDFETGMTLCRILLRGAGTGLAFSVPLLPTETCGNCRRAYEAGREESQRA